MLTGFNNQFQNYKFEFSWILWPTNRSLVCLFFLQYILSKKIYYGIWWLKKELSMAHFNFFRNKTFLFVKIESWNFVRFNEIINQRDAKNVRFLSWQTKKFYSWKILSVPCTMDSSFFSLQMAPWCLNFPHQRLWFSPHVTVREAKCMQENISL